MRVRARASGALVVAALLVFGGASAAASPAGSDGQQDAPTDSRSRARALFLQGKRHHAEGDFEAAIAAFQAAAKLHASPLLDHNIGRCFDQLGRRAEAIARYEAYLRGAPQAPNRVEVRRRVELLKRQLAEQKRDPYADLEEAPPAGAPAAAGTRSTADTATTHSGATAPPPTVVSPPAASPASTPLPAPAPAPTPGSAATPTQATRAPAPALERSRSAASPASPASPAAPSTDKRWAQPPPDEGPIYAQWWFWVAMAGAAAITGFIIATAVSGGDSSDAPPARQQAGLLTLEF